MSRQDREAGPTETEGSNINIKSCLGQAYVFVIVWTPYWNCGVNLSAKTWWEPVPKQGRSKV